MSWLHHVEAKLCICCMVTCSSAEEVILPAWPISAYDAPAHLCGGLHGAHPYDPPSAEIGIGYGPKEAQRQQEQAAAQQDAKLRAARREAAAALKRRNDRITSIVEKELASEPLDVKVKRHRQVDK